MKIKSRFAQKLIIILIALMVFNIAIPKQVKAVDLGGILMKPIGTLITTVLVSIDVTVSLFLTGADGDFEEWGEQADEVLDENGNVTFVGPDSIFKGDIKMLDANFFNAQSSGNDYSFEAMNLPYQIKRAISSLYIILRNLSASIMLAGLIFIGIKILASSNHPQKKAQWMMYLTDWVVGLALLIFMHVMMVGVFYISDTLTKILGSTMWGSGGIMQTLIDECLGSWELATQVICIIMLGYLIYLTIIFAIAYFKRMLWLAILIVFAPVMAVMYSFGNATKQTFSRWIKDYIMTVCVQPFHMLVYSVLITLPLNFANIGGGTLSEMFALIYALGAMAFIRPAEKYLRGLFGMDSGVAAQASFDSGKQTFDKIVSTAVSLIPGGQATGVAAKLVGKAGGLMGGTGAIAGKALEKFGDSTGAKETLGMVSSVASKIPHPAAQAVGAIAAFGASGGEKKEENVDLMSYATKGNKATAAETTDKSNKDSKEKNSSNDNKNNSKNENSDKGDSSNVSAENSDEGKYEQMPLFDDYYGDVAQNDNNASAAADAVNDSQAALMAALMASDKGGASLGNINANNVNINASNINMSGSQDNDGTATATANSEAYNDDKVDITNPGEEGKESKEKRGLILGDLADFVAVGTGRKGLFEKLSEDPKTLVGSGIKAVGTFPFKLAGKGIDKGLDKMTSVEGDGKGAKFVRKIGEKGQNVAEGIRNIPNFLAEFEKQGGMQKLYQGMHEIGDTFYVGGAPGDWQDKNNNMKNTVQQGLEQRKINFTSLQKNEWLIKNIEVKLREQYKDKNKYPDARIREMAKEKASQKLKSLSDTYVPLGITDARIAYECDEDCKKYGYSPSEAIQQRLNYEKFNINAENIIHVNDRYRNDDGSKNNYSSVSQAIGENTRDYYNNGYTKAQDMALVRDLTQTLNVSINKGMQLDQALRRKGGQIDYKNAGLSKAQEKQLGDILNQYKKISNNNGTDSK